MQTIRLRSLVSPAQTQTLLDSCVVELGIVSCEARKLREAWRLPIWLLDVAEKAIRRGEVWSAWMNGDNAWLFVGHLALDQARERGQPVLEIDCYETASRSRSHLISTRTAEGAWLTCTH